MSTSPDSESAAEKSAPQAIRAIRFRLSSTCFGMRTSLLPSSWPSLPKAPLPHEKTAPCDVTASVCDEPAATETIWSPLAPGRVPSVGTGYGMCLSSGGGRSSSVLPFRRSLSVIRSSPSWNCRDAPHTSSSPLSVATAEWPRPAEIAGRLPAALLCGGIADAYNTPSVLVHV